MKPVEFKGNDDPTSSYHILNSQDERVLININNRYSSTQIN